MRSSTLNHQDIDHDQNGNKLDSRPQFQFLILDGWQYAALANWVKGVKLDISLAAKMLTVLGSRSLSATSELPGSGTAPTEAKSSGTARRRLKGVEKKDESILDGNRK